MSKNIKMKDIAEYLGVSIVTVSKALADKSGVSEELRKKIKKVAIEMDYKPNRAKYNDNEISYNIGIIASERYLDEENAFYFTIYNNLVKFITEYNHYSFLEVIEIKKERENILPNIVLDNKVDAIIVLGQISKNYISSLKIKNLPIIFLDFYDVDFNVDSIFSDNVYNTYCITKYLIENGHKKIGYVGNIRQNVSILDRYLGYIKALIENNISINNSYVIDDRDEKGALETFNLPNDIPTAFVCNSDKTAYYFMKFLNSKGFKIPEDISIVGFDNDMYSKISNPSITTVQIDIEDMAKKCVKRTLKRIKNKLSKVDKIIISGNIIIRESVKSI